MIARPSQPDARTVKLLEEFVHTVASLGYSREVIRPWVEDAITGDYDHCVDVLVAFWDSETQE